MTNSTGTSSGPVAATASAEVARSFRRARLCAVAYLGLSAATLLAAGLLHRHADLVTPTVWVRGTIVTASAVLTLALVARAARGSRGAHRRLRLLSGVMLTAIVVLLAVPGSLPLWVKVEQGVCGLLLAALLALVSAARVRAALAAS
ncbi:hypothetical protein [Streptacidiphilus monticola]|uniref:Integral membrane protein n=1 Tax=Streptacidiphilus monticola TaxID=2161674 RepID=A0ABW1FXE4_9ACTN